MKTYEKVVFITLSLLNYYNAAQAAEVKTAEATGVIFENVSIFNGTADQLSAPSNVLVVVNVIKSISAEAIVDPDGMKITRIQGV